MVYDPNLPAYGGSDGGGDGGDYPIDGSDQCTKYCDLPEPTACGTPPASLNDLGSEKDLGRVQDHCVNLFLMHVLYDECQAALDKYQKLMNDGFDDDFNRYRDYVLESIQPQILEFMRKHAGEYFDCKKLDERPCCSKCTSAQGCQNG
ncbi:hypothetical protein SLS60_010032 [Paraconiothyrium brasiliense]|uniref:Uncharacterized protein n=1 Tax=Paraconiothyrium brasiliense TaxID=300254 RepID=A0ABR3QT56_9PLEO